MRLSNLSRDSPPLQDSLKALVNMRRISKEKELEALLAGEQDPCSCFIEVFVVDIHKWLLVHQYFSISMPAFVFNLNLRT